MSEWEFLSDEGLFINPQTREKISIREFGERFSKQNQTKGVVRSDFEESSSDIVIEKAEEGKGWQIWGDYNKNPKLKRLVRA